MDLTTDHPGDNWKQIPQKGVSHTRFGNQIQPQVTTMTDDQGGGRSESEPGEAVALNYDQQTGPNPRD